MFYVISYKILENISSLRLSTNNIYLINARYIIREQFGITVALFPGEFVFSLFNLHKANIICEYMIIVEFTT